MFDAAKILSALALLLGACTTPSAEPTDDVEVTDTKADGATLPTGAFWHDGATGDELAELILFPDTSYIRVSSLDHDSIRLRGTYKFTKWEDRTYIRFYDSYGEYVDRYRYYVNGSVLKVRPAETSTSTGPYQPLFTEAKGTDAWALAVKLDWFDTWFDIEPEVWSHQDISATELPAGAKAAYDALVQELGANSVDTYRFRDHGSDGFEVQAPDKVMLFDETGATAAIGSGTGDFFEFEWAD